MYPLFDTRTCENIALRALFNSFSCMKKQSGFTLIELMVVMAIIAILATAGLSAYTGYIKKARDTTRIADLAALNTIVLGQLGSTGEVPKTAGDVNTAANTANNSTDIQDPLDGTAACLDTASGATVIACHYEYKVCDSGTGYALATRFESSANQPMYANDDAGAAAADATRFEMGTCKTACSGTLCPVANGYTGADAFVAI